MIRKQGTESNPNKNVFTTKNIAFQKSDSKTVNQTKISPWIKLGSSDKKETVENKNQLASTRDRLNQIKLIATGGLSSSFYDQLLYYTRKKNHLNLFGENEKTRTSELDLHLTRQSSDGSKRDKKENEKADSYEDKKEINNQSVPMHSLTKLHCDPRRNCAKNQAAQTSCVFNSLGLSKSSNKILHSIIFFAFYNYFFDIK